MTVHEVHAPLTGGVWKIEVRPGTKVAEGDVLMILESMKMEIPVDAPGAGTVASIAAKEGDRVEEGQLLATVEVG